MKAFSFRLDRVLDWRRILVQTEQSKLERIRAEIALTDAREAELRRSAENSITALQSRRSTTGMELAAHDTFRQHVARERGRLAARRAQLQKQFSDQAQVVMNRERDVKLIEKLREQRRQAWLAEQDAEIQKQAEETYLARWSRIQ